MNSKRNEADQNKGIDETMKIEIYSDIVCPWCYVGKRRLDWALATLSPQEPIDDTCDEPPAISSYQFTKRRVSIAS